MNNNQNFSVVNPHLKFRKVSLAKASDHHFILLAAEIDYPLLPIYLTESSKKKRLLQYCKEACLALEQLTGIEKAVVFKARLISPGRGELLKKRKEQVHIAKFDLVILVELSDASMLDTIKSNGVYQKLARKITKNAHFIRFLSASNIKSIGLVNTRRQGVFLFNFFFADNRDQNLAAWEYTAGWFQQETGLDNSTLLLPDEPEKSQYTIINYCRWDKLSDILPSLLFKRTFKTYVLANFFENNVAPMPILYKLA